jgi:RimJ/RimL family protein N-acetyltransferase
MPLWPTADRLEGPRLTLEPLRVEHAVEMAPVLSDSALYVHIGGSPPSLDELRARYSRQSVGTSPDGRNGWLNWVLRLRDVGRPVGFVQVTLGGGEPMEAALAWLVAPSEQGAGLATEATTTVVEWLRSVGTTTLTAHIHPDNAASATVARRLGLVPTDVSEGGETLWVAR